MMLQLLGIQIVTFIVLILILRMLFGRQLNVALTKLRRLHEENLVREEQLKAELEEARLKKEQELAQAKEEADRIVKEAKIKSEKLGADIQKQAREQGQKIMDQSQLELKRLENDLESKYQARAVDLSVKLLKATFTGHGQEILQHQLIAELIDELKKLDKSQFTVKSKEAKVLSAYPLTRDEKASLDSILSEKMGMKIALEETINHDVIAGLIIQIGALTIDGGLKNKIKKVVPFIKD